MTGGAALERSEFVVLVDVDVIAALDTVWAAMVEEDRRVGWWPGLALHAVPGSLLQELWTDREGVERVGYGVVHDVRRGQFLRFSWADSRWGAPTTVEWSVCPTGPSSTRVSIRETGLEHVRDSAELFRVHQSGWRLRLDNLRDYVEQA
ncbi:hypothetical protein GCM10010399_21700 [Dactylosporangium fulvum]|uniref:SRPBCC domain-containing protein n=1 Tax=Dactylosporangium fulvum TaxID=53359 RepID=A0ABY5W8C2_9ACTN|nr:SRPBCC domain-containing protein [Dactylosporangium fulvum]UWP85566.1 SRPBCC domain-containing protein [Dactylosporangium fulvum]